ncbi:MAG TPA: hypothetical protein VMV51_01420 [Gemmatimonadaceae bacterium]|nr:hypothetical protein [Gemmatimonadaceae bacterium]
MPDSPARRLHAIRADFGAAAGVEKAALIERLTHQPPTRRAAVVRLHDDLLFLRAFPDSPAVLRAAARALAGFDRVVRALGAARHAADDSGMTGTVSHDAYAFATVEWLDASFPGEVDIDWAQVDDESAIDGLLRPALQRAEEDAFDSGELTTHDWLVLRKGGRRETDLARLLRLAPRRGAARDVFRLMYDAADVPLRWRLAGSRGAATHAVLPTPRPVFRQAMRRPPAAAARHIATPTRVIERLSPARARAVIHLARAALASRGREVFAVYAANPAEVYLADLGEGASIAVIGVLPEHRMSLEANYGYLMLSNGVPVGYGGVTPLYRQANTGLNIFPSFRGGEAAYLWVAALRAFRSLFRVTRFVVNAKQVGEGNREAIASGAFWFYYKLGFRPADAATGALAAREFRRLGRRGPRTAPATLRALAHGDLHLDLGRVPPSDFFDERWLVDVSRGATVQLAGTGARALADRLGQLLGCPARGRWPADERAAFARLAPVCLQLPGLARWSDARRRAMVALLRAKGRPQERDFVLAARRDPNFYPALIRLASRG